jgi:hypothetical protein
LNLLLLAFALAGLPAHAVSDTAAQERPGIRFVTEPARGGLALRVHAVLADPALEDAVRSGLPLRVRVRIELWRDRFIDQLTAAAEWQATLLYDPVAQEFVARAGSAASARDRAFAGVRGIVERDHGIGIVPDRAGRYYYAATLEIETLSLSDLEELERWLQGELQPAVAGERALGGALGQGVKRLLIRMLRLPAHRYETRSARFVAGG